MKLSNLEINPEDAEAAETSKLKEKTEISAKQSQLQTPMRRIKSAKSLSSAGSNVPKSEFSVLLNEYPTNFYRKRANRTQRPLTGSLTSKKPPGISPARYSIDTASPQIKRRTPTPGAFMVKSHTIPFFLYSKPYFSGRF